MKIDINTDNIQQVQTTNAPGAVSAVPAGVEKTATGNPSAGLSKDMWDKRNLMNSIKAAWDSDDTATISDTAKRGVGIVGDPRIVGDLDAE